MKPNQLRDLNLYDENNSNQNQIPWPRNQIENLLNVNYILVKEFI